MKGAFVGGQVRVEGTAAPLAKELFLDVKVQTTSLDLPKLSPYSGRHVGYTISKGKLDLNLHYKINASLLEAENNILLDQFYLGQSVASPEAVKLPLKLALALLRNTNGKISLEIPVRGNLKDPDFRYGKVVWQTLGNILVKAAASPFKLLGGLIGAQEDLSMIEFASGSAELSPTSKQRLAQLGKALTQRPELTLELSSNQWTPLDTAGLRENLLRKKLLEMRRRELASSGQASTQAHDALVLSQEDEDRLVRLAFAALPTASLAADTSASNATGKNTTASPTAISEVPASALVSVSQVATPSPVEQAATVAPVALAPAQAPKQSRWLSWLTRPFVWLKKTPSPVVAKPVPSTLVTANQVEPSVKPEPATPAAVSAPTSATTPAPELTSAASAVAEVSAVPLTLEQMRARLLERQTLAETDFRVLAERRAMRVVRALSTEHGIDPQRILTLDAEKDDHSTGSVMLKFSLK